VIDFTNWKSRNPGGSVLPRSIRIAFFVLPNVFSLKAHPRSRLMLTGRALMQRIPCRGANNNPRPSAGRISR
jgi:hypothetical protein